MNNLYLAQALQIIKNPNILVNVVSQRVRQLGQGHKAMVAASSRMSYMDIALKEISEGKLTYEASEVPGLQEVGDKGRSQKRK